MCGLLAEPLRQLDQKHLKQGFVVKPDVILSQPDRSAQLHQRRLDVLWDLPTVDHRSAPQHVTGQGTDQRRVRLDGQGQVTRRDRGYRPAIGAKSRRQDVFRRASLTP